MGCGGSKSASGPQFRCTHPGCGQTFATHFDLQNHATTHVAIGAPVSGVGPPATTASRASAVGPSPPPSGYRPGPPGAPGGAGGYNPYTSGPEGGGMPLASQPSARALPGPGPGPAIRSQPSLSSQMAPPPNATASGVGAAHHQIDIVDIQLEGEVGRGAYGVVFEGRVRSERVAIKQLDVKGGPENPEYHSQLKEFQDEAEFMIKLPYHPNVVKLVGVTPPPNFWIVTEFLSKGSLYSLLHSNDACDNRLKLHIVRGTALGMGHLHKHNIIHRDLAARNILLSDSFDAKISDFGLSRFADPDAENKTKSDIGPIKWMAPEAIKNKVYSPKSDVWSMGVLTWEVATRSNPYPDMDLITVATSVCYKGLTPSTPPNAPPEIKQILSMCFKRNPAERATMNELAAVIRA